MFPHIANELLRRILTAGLLVLVVLPLIYLGGPWRTLLLLIIFGVCMFEYYRTAIPLSRRWVLGLVAASMLMPISFRLFGPDSLLFLMVIALYFMASIIVLALEMNPESIQPSKIYLPLVSGFFYPMFPLLVLMWVDQFCGGDYILWIAACVIAADTCAYFVGRLAGGRPLAIRISPNKTLSGSLAGILGAALVSVSYGIGFELPETLPQLLLVGFLVGALSVLGDLFESVLKRALGTKDMGNILPGHGGVLDRIDAMLFSFPILLFI